MGFWIQKNVLFPTSFARFLLLLLSRTRYTTRELFHFASAYIVVPIAFTLAKIVASAKVKGKKERSKKTARRRVRSFEKRQPGRGWGPFYITNGSLKSFKRSRRESRAFSQRRRSNGRERERETRAIASKREFHPALKQREREREREREPLRRRRFNFVDRFFPEKLFQKKKEEREERTELFRGDGPVAVFIEQSERFFEFGDLLVGEFSRHCCYFFF